MDDEQREEEPKREEDPQRDGLDDELVEVAGELLPIESFERDTTDDELLAAEELTGGASPLKIAFSEPAAVEELLAAEALDEQDVSSLHAGLRIAPSSGDLPLSHHEAVFGQPPSLGRLNVSSQPHARKIPIHYEPQPSFETSEDVPGIVRGPYRPEDNPGRVRDLVYRHSDPQGEPQKLSDLSSSPVQTTSGPSTVDAGEAPAAEAGPGNALPRLLVTVSMANARSIFQDCIDRASQTLGAKFHSACQSTVNDYARERRAAERAASRWGG